MCYENCECCKKYANKKIPIEKIKELPIKECPLNARLCIARYRVIIEF